MFGPRIVGDNGIELRPPTLEDYKLFTEWQMRPEVTRFWGPRFTTEPIATAEERLKRHPESGDSVSWSIAYGRETVGFTGISHISQPGADGQTRIVTGWYPHDPK